MNSNSFYPFITDYRWIGNFVVSTLGVVTLFYFTIRKGRPAWLLGATILVSQFIVLFLILAFLCDRPSAWFSPQLLLAHFSAVPFMVLEAVITMRRGGDTFVEEHLMIPAALVMWGAVGAAIGATASKIRNRRREY
jgi:hypothetical protein